MIATMYECDGKLCENCHEECHHTTDPRHAKNFTLEETSEINGEKYLYAKEKLRRKKNMVLCVIVSIISLCAMFLAGLTFGKKLYLSYPPYTEYFKTSDPDMVGVITYDEDGNLIENLTCHTMRDKDEFEKLKNYIGRKNKC